LWANPNRRSAEVHGLVTEKVRDIDAHILELKAMKKMLSELLVQCLDDDNPNCAIMSKLAEEQE
jgi:hypothetical protein